MSNRKTRLLSTILHCATWKFRIFIRRNDMRYVYLYNFIIYYYTFFLFLKQTTISKWKWKCNLENSAYWITFDLFVDRGSIYRSRDSQIWGRFTEARYFGILPRFVAQHQQIKENWHIGRRVEMSRLRNVEALKSNRLSCVSRRTVVFARKGWRDNNVRSRYKGNLVILVNLIAGEA